MKEGQHWRGKGFFCKTPFRLRADLKSESVQVSHAQRAEGEQGPGGGECFLGIGATE